tara:strand:- start:1108 stop:1491 length:384 start_codon:yes stop_codon:yes gene_type:complete
MKINVPISVGELFDKISILEIKTQKIKDTDKLTFINHELKLLKNIAKKKKLNRKIILSIYEKLKRINKRLWIIEERKRNFESHKNFNKEFITLARNVYLLNDKRAKLKFKINVISGSEIKEIKSHNK